MADSQLNLEKIMLLGFGVESPRTLNELAEVFRVSAQQLDSWEADCPALRESPIDVAKCALQLLAKKHLSPELLFEKAKDGKQTTLQLAFITSLLKAGVEAYDLTDFLESAIASDPLIATLISSNDIEGAKTAMRMSGPFKRKRWNALNSQDSTVIAITQPKTAALFFDRVWCPDYSVPADIGFRCHTLAEKIALGLLDGAVDMITGAILNPEERLNKIRSVASENLVEIETILAPLQENLILQPLRKATGLKIRPFLGSQSATKGSFQPGEYQVLLPMLQAIQVVDESQLLWDQVQEFRKDASSKRALRRLLNWLDMDLASKPLAVVQNHLAMKLDDYEASISKHGIRTVVGTLGTVISDWKSWTTAASAWCAGNTIGEMGGISVGFGVTAKIAIDFWTIRNQMAKELNQPIAYLNSVNKLVK